MNTSRPLRFPHWKTLYWANDGTQKPFESDASTLAAHLELLALQPDYSKGSTAEHELCWEPVRPS